MSGPGTQPRFRVHPLQAAVLLVGAVAVLGGAAWGYARAAPDVDVVGLELAGTVAAARQVVGADAAGFVDAVQADFLLIAGYVAALLLVGCSGWACSGRRGPGGWSG